MSANTLRLVAAEASTSACDQFDLVLPEVLVGSVELSSEAKLIGALLWALSERRPESIVRSTAPLLGAAIGKSEARARQVVQELVAAGFVGRVEGRRGRGGGYELRVFGPEKLVERFKLRQGPDADQLSLLPADTPDGPAEGPDQTAGIDPNSCGLIGPPAKTAGFTSDSCGLALNTAPARARAVEVNSLEETSTTTSTSTLSLKLLFLKSPASDRERIDQIAAACRLIERALSEAMRFPHGLHSKFVVLAAMLAAGVRVRAWCGGNRNAWVELESDDVESVLRAATRVRPENVTRSFYGLLRDRIRQVAGETARMPGTPQIREAVESIGWTWKESWELSPRMIHAERLATEEAHS